MNLSPKNESNHFLSSGKKPDTFLFLIGSFRFINQDPHQYSWWSYRANSRANNKRWRIDYNIVSKSLENKILDAKILSDVVHSDHCPVKLKLKI